jgi:flagellar assembly factor FliW
VPTPTKQDKISDTDFQKSQGEQIKIKSRFGEITVELEKAIYFPKGLYGFPEDLHFAISHFPNSTKLDQFSILQCINDHSISLPVMPCGYNNPFIDEKDMEICLDTVDVPKEQFAMLFIATSKKNKEGSFEISINSKAPIIIDTKLQIAVQYIFTNNKYSINQKIAL